MNRNYKITFKYVLKVEGPSSDDEKIHRKFPR